MRPSMLTVVLLFGFLAMAVMRFVTLPLLGYLPYIEAIPRPVVRVGAFLATLFLLSAVLILLPIGVKVGYIKARMAIRNIKAAE